MEEDNGLELSLALPCGGSSAISKGKSGSSSDNRTDDGDRGTRLIDDFKSFLHGGPQKAESSHRNETNKPEENFFNNLSKGVVDADASTNMNGGGIWNANNDKSTEVEEGQRGEAGRKRKNLYEEINHKKKHEREAHQADLHEKRTSHISITTDDGSTTENEDVADSEVDGSSSRLVSHCNDASKRYSGSSEAPKEVRGISDSCSVDVLGQKGFTITSDKEFRHGNMPFGVSFPGQSVNIMNLPSSLPMKESNTVGTPKTSIYPLSGLMQVVTAANSERPGTLSAIPACRPPMFDYSSVQLPMMDKDNSRGIVSHSQQLYSSYSSRGPSMSDMPYEGLKISQAFLPGIPHKLSEATQDTGGALERAKGDWRQHSMEEGASSQREGDGKGSKAMDASDQPRAEGLPSEYPAIRPGIAAELKFGGGGSYPNLPWVSTTGPGPNGRTISGVTYRYSATQIRIVCACHGSHMSPEEFVQHAGEEPTNPDGGTGLGPFPNSNPAASAQS